MRYAKIIKTDSANGIGVGQVLFVQGCDRFCKGCFNPETWDFCGGEEWTKEIEDQFIKDLNRPYIKRLTIVGGEPLHDKNVESVYNILIRAKQVKPNISIWIYSGFRYEDISDKAKECLSMADILVDGPFIEELKDVSLNFRGSSNQRIIDLKSTTNDNIVLLDL